MKFHVGPEVYTLIVSDRAVFNVEGDEVAAMAVEDRRLLILSFRVEPQRREELARHEMLHAWEFHVPVPRTAEERAQFFALAGKQFDQDLETAGGNEALERMLPASVNCTGRPAAQRTAAPARETYGAPDRKECECGSDIMCGSISNGEPSLHGPTAQYRIERWARCDACGGLLAWGEICAPDGTPLGTLVANPPPKILRGREAAIWLAGRAEAAAVL